MSTSFLVQLPSQWKKLTGTGYGQRQPLLLGNLLGCAAGEWITGFDAWMGEALSEPLPADLGPDLSARGVVQRLLHWTSVAQRWCGIPVFGMGQVLAVNPGRAEEFLVALPYATPHAVPHAMNWVLGMMQATAAQGVPALVQDGAAQLTTLVEGMRPFQVAVTNDYWFLAAAANDGIPVSTVCPGTFSYGQGRWARWMSSALTDATSHLGFRSTDKQLTAAILRRQGLPGAEHLPVGLADDLGAAGFSGGGQARRPVPGQGRVGVPARRGLGPPGFCRGADPVRPHPGGEPRTGS